MALSISGGDGGITSQAKTQTPQASVGPSINATSSGQVQPGTASSLLNTQSGGISLTSHELPTVTVSASASASQTAKSEPEPAAKNHHPNAALFGFAILLLVIAAVIFALITHSAKTTTK